MTDHSSDNGKRAMQPPTEQCPGQPVSRATSLAAYGDCLKSEGKAAIICGLLFLAMNLSAGVTTPYDFANVAVDLFIVGYGVAAWRLPLPASLLVSAA